MSRKYKNAPIVEAIVDIHFLGEIDEDWYILLPGKFHNEIKSDYEGDTRLQKTIQTQVQSEGDSPIGVGVREAVARVQFFNEAESRVVGVGQNNLLISTLRPYDSWEDFKPRVERALHAYQTVVGEAPVSRVGVRYINRFSYDPEKFSPTDLLPFCINADAPIKGGLTNSISRQEYSCGNGKVILLSQGVLPISKDNPELVLDVDVIWAGEPLVEFGGISSLIDDLHSQEGEIFESLITDRARELFDA